MIFAPLLPLNATILVFSVVFLKPLCIEKVTSALKNENENELLKQNIS